MKKSDREICRAIDNISASYYTSAINRGVFGSADDIDIDAGIGSCPPYCPSCSMEWQYLIINYCDLKEKENAVQRS